MASDIKALELAEKLFKQGKKVHTYYGMGLNGQEIMEEDFRKYGSFTAAADDGQPARILDIFSEDLANQKEMGAHYTMGPLSFMKKASAVFEMNGGREEDLYLSLETPTRCGVGLCGECECDGHLTCREGTFFSYSYLSLQDFIKILLHKLIQ